MKSAKYRLNLISFVFYIVIVTICISCTPWNLEKKEFPICNKPEITVFALPNTNTLSVSFSISNEKGPIKRALWDFGDGGTLAQLNAGTHSYAASGTYKVKLQIWNACDESTTYNINVTVISLPTVTTLLGALPTDKSINLNMAVVANGGAVINRYGICLSSTNNNPTIDNSTISSSNINPNTSSTYSFSFSNLTPKTKYYYRAFAQNAFGTAYGNVLTTNTLPVIGHTQIASFPALGRDNPVSFTIGTKIYVGMGKDANGTYKNDLWEYDTKEYTWTAKQSLPDVGRVSCVSFSINGKGYIGLGNSANGMLKDFWEYNPSTDTWLKKADFPSNARWAAYSISNNSLGYVGGGTNGLINFNDFWEYNPNFNQWTSKINLPYYKVNGTGFSIDNNIYLGFGQNMTSSTSSSGANGFDFFQFDSNNNRWIPRTNIPSDIFTDTKFNFSIGGKGYIGRVDKDAPTNMRIYIYNPSSNQWERNFAFDIGVGNSPRYFGFSVVVDNIGYYGLGGSLNIYTNSFWIFRPL